MLPQAQKIYDLYQWRDVLQEGGAGGKVVICQAKMEKSTDTGCDGKEFVMKMRAKEKFESADAEEHFRRVQKRILALPPEPGIVPIREVLEDSKFYYVVMDKAEGGPMLQGLLNEFTDGVIPADVLKRVLRQLIEALGSVHGHGILHRDIKPDNIVMHNGRIMLIDFDHADPDWDSQAGCTQSDMFFGTYSFIAPEAFLGYYSQQSDLYSVGCVLYLLMTGKMPRGDEIFGPCFDLNRRSWSEEVFRNLEAAGEIDWNCDPWPDNATCREFCQTLLSFQPSHRPSSTQEALKHEWFVADVS
jgi:serine/threonine protein kinase